MLLVHPAAAITSPSRQNLRINALLSSASHAHVHQFIAVCRVLRVRSA